MKKKISLSNLSVFILIIFLFMYNAISRVYFAYSFFINIVIVLVLFFCVLNQSKNLLLFRKNYKNYVMFSLGISFLLVAIFFFKGMSITTQGFVPVVMQGCFYSTIAMILSINYSYRFKRTTTYTILMISLFAMIDGYIAMKLYPHAARMIAGAITGNDALVYLNKGVPSFGFVYYISFLTYPMLCLFKVERKKICKVFTLFFIVFAFIFLIESEYSMALLVYISSLLAYCFNRIPIKQFRVFVVIVFIVFVIASLSGLSDMLYEILRANGLNTQATKILQIINFANTNDATSITRFALYGKSIHSFLSHPLFGDSTCGLHSQIFDAFALLGLFALLFVAFLWVTYKKNRIPLITDKDYVFEWVMFFVFIVLNTFLTSGQVVGTFLVMPVLRSYIKAVKDNTNNNRISKVSNDMQ